MAHNRIEELNKKIAAAGGRFAHEMGPGMPTPEWKTQPRGTPDRYVRLVRTDNGQQVGIEWSTNGKRIDLTREADGLPRRTLIRTEGDDRPRYLLGKGIMIDIKTSMETGVITTTDMRSYLAQQSPSLVVTIGQPMWAGADRVSGVLQEDVGAGHVHDIDPAASDMHSPFEDVEDALRSLPNSTQQLNNIAASNSDLSWLIQA